eukprot:scaffold1970_cov396-Prasinococcus_capsulatus_cf.AAC.23
MRVGRARCTAAVAASAISSASRASACVRCPAGARPAAAVHNATARARPRAIDRRLAFLTARLALCVATTCRSSGGRGGGPLTMRATVRTSARRGGAR